ncbi:unnamed protein product [Prunus armeniaca]
MIHNNGSYFLTFELKYDVICFNKPSSSLIYHDGKQSSRKSPIWKNLQGTPRQPTNVECGYYVMRFMRDIIHELGLAFEKKFNKKKEPVVYTQELIDKVRLEWAEFVNKLLQNNK